MLITGWGQVGIFHLFPDWHLGTGVFTYLTLMDWDISLGWLWINRLITWQCRVSVSTLSRISEYLKAYPSWEHGALQEWPLGCEAHGWEEGISLGNSQSGFLPSSCKALGVRPLGRCQFSHVADGEPVWWLKVRTGSSPHNRAWRWIQWTPALPILHPLA